ncbi:MAG TPA: tyrosine-type recombinase/integrase [Edaphobacter sp.]|nr:tyrosine-type recombinase/integrase [Edaphobacter sp.]
MNRLQRPVAAPYLHLIDEFANHMEHDKGLSPMTIRSERGHVKEFLDRYWADDHVLSNISIKHIDEAIAAKGTRGGCTRGTIQFYAASLRSFFRYAETKQWCQRGLAEAIMAPRVYQHELIPAGPPWNIVERLLASTEGDRAVDIRDRAILMLFASYGLRSEEVQRLQLEDLDWEQEVIHVLRPKPRRVQQFPLLPGVGEAILRYLTEIRLRRPSRHVFLTVKAPYSPLSRSALWKAVSDRLRPLNASIRHHGPHALRHACATRLLAEGFSMKEIADHLGHRDLDSTGVYAKVDIRGLREVAEFDLGGPSLVTQQPATGITSTPPWQGSIDTQPAAVTSCHPRFRQLLPRCHRALSRTSISKRRFADFWTRPRHTGGPTFSWSHIHFEPCCCFSTELDCESAKPLH